MNKPLFNCGICGHDWPDDYLKCPDKECQAPFRMRVARETLRPQEAALLQVPVPEPVKRHIVQLLTRRHVEGYDTLNALANDGTVWVLTDTGWFKVIDLPDA